MKMVFTSQDSLLLNHMKNLLDNSEIACFLKNQFLTSGAGEIPPVEVWPELWIEEDTDYEAALAIIKNPPEPGNSWQCPECGEWSEGQFSQCWSCGASRPNPKD